MAKFIQYSTKESQYDGPFDSKVGWAAAGMGDIVVTDNGRLIVIDGGCRNDGEGIVEMLEELSGGKKPVVDQWIITHPHLDHYGAIQEICRNEALANRIEVTNFMYFFPLEFCDGKGNPGCLRGPLNDMDEILAVTGATSHTPARDEIFNIDGVEIRFVFVPDDCSLINTAGGNSNHCSLIFTVKGPKKQVMVTGDAYGRSMRVTGWRYAKGLKSDVLQMPHHALADSHCADFYHYVSADILLLPTSVAGYRAMHSDLYYKLDGCIANLSAEALAKEVYKAFEGHATIEI